MDPGRIQSIKREIKDYLADYGKTNDQNKKTFYKKQIFDLSTILNDHCDAEVINIMFQIHELTNTQSNKSSILKPANNTICRDPDHVFSDDILAIKERANILIETKALLLHQSVVDEVEAIFHRISSLKETFTNDDKKLGQITDLKNDLCLKFKEYVSEDKKNLLIIRNKTILQKSRTEHIIRSRPPLVMRNDTPSLGNIVISEDARGYTYERIFDKYLNTEKHNADQCTEVTIKDAFIRNPFQFQNLNLFVAYVMYTFKNLKCITVVTRNINTLEELRHRKKRFFKKDENEIKQKLFARQATFETKLSEINQNCKQKSVAFNLEINRNIHDRHILFNHGIIVSMGRGLDIFKKTQNPNDIRSKIPCYETQFTFFNAFELEKSF